MCAPPDEPSRHVDAVPTPMDADALDRLGVALGDATRRAIIRELLDGPGYPAQLAATLDTSRANVSNHLACLRGCGLVQTTSEGRNVRYDLVTDEFGARLAELVTLLAPVDPDHPHRP